MTHTESHTVLLSEDDLRHLTGAPVGASVHIKTPTMSISSERTKPPPLEIEVAWSVDKTVEEED